MTGRCPVAIETQLIEVGTDHLDHQLLTPTEAVQQSPTTSADPCLQQVCRHGHDERISAGHRGCGHGKPLFAAPAEDSNLRSSLASGSALCSPSGHRTEPVCHTGLSPLNCADDHPCTPPGGLGARAQPRAQPVDIHAGTSGKPQVRDGSPSGRATAPARAFVQVRGEMADESAYTPGSVTERPCGPSGDGHPSRAVVAGSLVRSTRGLGRAALERPRRVVGRRPLLTLLRVGFT